MPAARLPEGRLSVAEFCRLAGVSKARFYAKIRWSEDHIRDLDIREDPQNGSIHLSADAAAAFAQARLGRPATGPSSRVANLGQYAIRKAARAGAQSTTVSETIKAAPTVTTSRKRQRPFPARAIRAPAQASS